MNLFNPPMLGLESDPSVPTTVVWQDGTVCGILDLTFDPEGAAAALAAAEAEQARQEQIRQSDNVIVLDNWRSR